VPPNVPEEAHRTSVYPVEVKGETVMGMSGGAGPGGLQSEINVTPMVDIMLVLLIIFMVVTPFLQQGITVALPKNMNNPDIDPNIIKESSIVISIPNDGEYYLAKQRVAKEQLTEKVDSLLEKIKNENDRIVYIKSGVGVSYGDVVNVINEVRKLGVDKIGLVADKKKKGGAVAPAPAG
jgi:biopolymer transport protein ExbD/biopolymer transport protein TolR